MGHSRMSGLQLLRGGVSFLRLVIGEFVVSPSLGEGACGVWLFLFEIIHSNPQVIWSRRPELLINAVHTTISPLTLERQSAQPAARCQMRERKQCVIPVHLSVGWIWRFHM